MDSTANGSTTEVQRRREALKLSKAELARESGVNRDTITDLEKGGGYQASTMEKLTETLTRLETETGLSAPVPIGDPFDRLISFEVRDARGVIRVVVRGTYDHLDELREAALKLAGGLPSSPDAETSR